MAVPLDHTSSIVTPPMPPRPHFLVGLGHAVNELAGFVRHLPHLRATTRLHDRQPVLVLPGFLAHDVFTLGLRKVLSDLGYPTYGWKQGVNIGPTDSILEGLRTRVEEVHAIHNEPISIIGWSLGGLYARQIARERPDLVRQVITLGSPIQLTMDHTHLTAVHVAFDLLKRFYSDDLEELGKPEHLKAPLRVPATSIFTKHDEVVPWDSCVDEYGHPHLSENIEVRGSHVGLAQNRSAMHAILDRLALPHGGWHHFVPHPDHRHHYPRHHQPERESALDR